ncbi:MAG: winged helix-turn-helix domain-containing protein [Prevotella histicola]|nr:winged helix-turn-helix domain-containing protein [Prevotella histicola]
MKSPKQMGRPKKFVDDEEILIYKQAGWSNRTIAISLGVSKDTINRRVRKLIENGIINPDKYDYNFSNPSVSDQPRRKNKERWEMWHGPGV